MNKPILNGNILANDHATRSDHEVIEWGVEADKQEEADNEIVLGCNLAVMTEKDLEAAEKLWMESAKKKAQLDAPCTDDEVEQEAAWCQEAISNILNATAKMITIYAK